MTNPIISTTQLLAAPCWDAVEHEDGTYIANHRAGVAFSMGLGSFRDCVTWALAEERGLDPVTAVFGRKQA